MRGSNSLLRAIALIALVAFTPSPAFADHLIRNAPGSGDEGMLSSAGSPKASEEAAASLRKLAELTRMMQEGGESGNNARQLLQDGGIGSLLDGIERPDFGELLGNANPFQGGNLADFEMPNMRDILTGNLTFSTGSLFASANNTQMPARIERMLRAESLSAEERAALQVTSAAFFLTSAICFTVFGGLAIGAFSGQLFAAGLGVITGPYGWALAVQQSWNGVLSPRNSGRENFELWASQLRKTAERVDQLNTGGLRSELLGLRSQISGLSSLLSVVQSGVV